MLYTASVADPERFDADPDPNFQADADPDPRFCKQGREQFFKYSFFSSP